MNRFCFCMFVLTFFISVIFPGHCSGRNNITVYILIDKDFDYENNDSRKKHLISISDYMEKDIFHVLKKEGFDVEIIRSKEDCIFDKDVYLLKASIEDLISAGRDAGMHFVHDGPENIELEISYQLTDNSGTELINQKESCFSGRNWKFCIKELSRRIVRKILREVM